MRRDIGRDSGPTEELRLPSRLMLLRAEMVVAIRRDCAADRWIHASRSCRWMTRPKLWTVRRDMIAPATCQRRLATHIGKPHTIDVDPSHDVEVCLLVQAYHGEKGDYHACGHDKGSVKELGISNEKSSGNETSHATIPRPSLLGGTTAVRTTFGTCAYCWSWTASETEPRWVAAFPLSCCPVHRRFGYCVSGFLQWCNCRGMADIFPVAPPCPGWG